MTRTVRFSTVMALTTLLALSASAFAQQAPLPNELQPIAVKPHYTKKEIAADAHVAAQDALTASRRDHTSNWTRLAKDLYSEHNKLFKTAKNGFDYFDAKSYARYMRQVNQEVHKSGDRSWKQDEIVGYATSNGQLIGIEIRWHVDKSICVMSNDGGILANVYVDDGKNHPRVDFAPAPEPAQPYVGIGVVLGVRFLRIENALKGKHNVTPDLQLDLTARAVDQSLPRDATKEQKTKAIEDYVKAATYSDEILPVFDRVIDGGPAAQAGVEEDDIIEQVDNKPVNGLTPEGLSKLLKDGPAASWVRITVLRTWKPDGSQSHHNIIISRGIVNAAKR